MTSSMTAFGRIEKAGDWGSAVWEIRSVNHRYLEMTVRLPEELRALEPGVRDRISASVARGKVECTLRFQQAGRGTRAAVAVNRELAAGLAAAAEALPIRQAAPIDPLDLLRWPGVLDNPVPDAEALAATLLSLLDDALSAMVETRRREGARIGALIEERCVASTALVSGLRPLLPEITRALRERYRQRAGELGVTLDRDRLEQEIVLLSQKMDVAEEIDRMETHLAEVLRILRQSEPVGRRLDFLMQELNREANTLASKAGSMQLTNASVDLKVLIEQMREQIQNVE
jgi:uncharacterized protein (TIGR00255 family)